MVIIRNPSYAKRRGVSTPMLLMCVMAALLFIVMAIDLAQLSIQRREMQFGGDMVSTSAVDVLMDRSYLYLGPAGSQLDTQLLAALPAMQQADAFDKAQTFAASNTVANSPIELREENVTFGYIAYPGAGDKEVTEPSDIPANTICIELTRSKLGDNPPVLWLAKQTGLASIDINTKSQATVATRIHGFQPLPRVNAPIVPLGLFKHRGEGSHAPGHSGASHGNSDDRPTQLWWAKGPQDQFSVNPVTGQVTLGKDKIAEMVFRLRLEDDENEEPEGGGDARTRPAALMGFHENHLDANDFERMAKTGVQAGDLFAYGGSITTRDDAPALCPCEFELTSQQLNGIYAALRHPDVFGRPRVWPVVADCSSVMGSSTVGIYGFVAGCVADCQMDGDELIVTIQPCLLQTPTALTDGMAQRNPWIGKLLLTR